MHELTNLIKNDMKPALGVTEPGAIAFAVAKARSYTNGELVSIHVAMNSGMYKNAFTCGIPGSNQVGNIYAAALGYVAGNADAGLQSLAGVTDADNAAAEKLVQEGKVTVSLSGITSRIFIEATVVTDKDEAVVTIHDSHTNITCIKVNGKVVQGAEEAPAEIGVAGTVSIAEAMTSGEHHLIHEYTLEQLVEYADTVPLEEIEFISEAYKVNLELFRLGLESDRTTFAKRLYEKNGCKEISDDEQKTASLMCNAAIEAFIFWRRLSWSSITLLS